MLSIEEEAVVVAFRRHTLLPLDDCLYALQATIPHLTRSSLHRCLQRHGISRLPQVDGDQRSHATEAHGELILSLYEATPDITLQELRAALAEQGASVGYGSLWRFFDRHRITVKKSRRMQPSRTDRTS